MTYNSVGPLHPACHLLQPWAQRCFKLKSFIPYMAAESLEFVIMGITQDGKTFRPSDWAERLAGCMSSFGGDGRLGYSPYCFPITSANVRCVVVDVRLKELEPMAHAFLLNFARDNDLNTRPGRIKDRDAG